jgi:hypothetical protein
MGEKGNIVNFRRDILSMLFVGEMCDICSHVVLWA